MRTEPTARLPARFVASLLCRSILHGYHLGVVPEQAPVEVVQLVVELPDRLLGLVDRPEDRGAPGVRAVVRRVDDALPCPGLGTPARSAS